MSAPRSRESRATAWTWVLLALPIVYVATLPLVEWMILGKDLWQDRREWWEVPAWFAVYKDPYLLMRKTPMRRYLDDYEDWVMRRLPPS
jgi:hypothetical protein